LRDALACLRRFAVGGEDAVIVHDREGGAADTLAKTGVLGARGDANARVVVKRVLVPGFLGAHAHAPPFVDIHVVVVVVVVPAKVVLLAAPVENKIVCGVTMSGVRGVLSSV
jgi:hypothetical protein